MFVALWEFEVKPGCEKRFQKVYGPEGDWAKLFRNDANYQETRLLHDTEHPAIYLTLDFWASLASVRNILGVAHRRIPEIRRGGIGIDVQGAQDWVV